MIKHKKRRYRGYNEKNRKYLLIFGIIVFIILGIVFLKMGLEYKENNDYIYSYEANKSDNYEAILNPNEFYTSNTLPKGLYYASKSIDKFALEFKYNFRGSKETDISYNYNIIAKMVATVANNDDQGKEVWNREFIILDNTSSNTNEDEFSINEKVDIDYEYYNNLARAYEEKYEISINAVLKVYFNISYSINIQGLEETSKTDYIELDIPITNTVTNIEENYESITSEEIAQQIAKGVSVNKIAYYIISAIFIISAVTLFIIMKKFSKKTPEEIYKSNIKHLLKYYKELIITVSNKPEFNDLKLMELNSIDDLIDVAEQNNSNIIHYEIIKNEKSELYVIINEYVYMYIITGEKLK